MINKELYKLTQKELLIYVQKYLQKMNIPFICLDNQIISIRNKNAPVFVAHMDTVKDIDMKGKLIEKNGKLYRAYGILGGDDRAGVNLILNNAKNINFIFTRDEEIGCVGSNDLIEDDYFIDLINDYNINSFIVLDRKNSNDLIGTYNNYCSIDLENEIIKATNNYYKPTPGGYSDADYFKILKPTVNLSVGYYNPHTPKEYLDIGVFKKINLLIPKINKKLTNKEFEMYYENEDYYEDDDIIVVEDNRNVNCCICGSKANLYYDEIEKEYICECCIMEKYNIYDCPIERMGFYKVKIVSKE